jgi:glyoxylase-like metal-dependent hydrolase (beta-lactamase superfamily II)
MRRGVRRLAAFALLLAALWPADAAARPMVQLWRLDCGTFITKRLANSCYLIRHGRDYLLWDSGFETGLLGPPKPDAKGSLIQLRETLPAQLAKLGIAPRQVTVLAISHAHFDHLGQAASFPKARLLIGAKDWPGVLANPEFARDLAPWTRGGAAKTLVRGDLDVFGDGTVVMLATPGHTAGHHSLEVRLARTGEVLLSGDLYHSEDQRASGTPAPHDADQAAARASMARFEALARRRHATVVIQHDPADVAKLPAFPKAAD